MIIGGVNRPDFSNVRLDLGAIKTLPFILSLGKGGDDHVLSRVVRFFEDKGYRVHGAGDVAPELLAGEGVLGAKAPSAEDGADIALGASRGAASSGASMSVRPPSSSKAMSWRWRPPREPMPCLRRCAELRAAGRAGKRGRAGVLVKVPKPGQEERVDLPTIGPDTVAKAAEAGLAGIAVAAGRVLMAERAATIEAADRHGLFLLGVTLA